MRGLGLFLVLAIGLVVVGLAISAVLGTVAVAVGI